MWPLLVTGVVRMRVPETDCASFVGVQVLAVAVYNHYKRIQLVQERRDRQSRLPEGSVRSSTPSGAALQQKSVPSVAEERVLCAYGLWSLMCVCVLVNPCCVGAVVGPFLSACRLPAWLCGAPVWRCREVVGAESAGEDDDVEVEKSNVLLMGPTGSGALALPTAWLVHGTDRCMSCHCAEAGSFCFAVRRLRASEGSRS